MGGQDQPREIYGHSAGLSCLHNVRSALGIVLLGSSATDSSRSEAANQFFGHERAHCHEVIGRQVHLCPSWGRDEHKWIQSVLDEHGQLTTQRSVLTLTVVPVSQRSARQRGDAPLGTEPNGHFDDLEKAVGHGLGTKWAQDGHKAKSHPVGGLRFTAGSLIQLHCSWLRGQDLNLRPLGYEPNELPGCSTPRQNPGL